MPMKQQSRKVYKTAQGKVIDMDMLRQKNELVPAVGNARVNARGDELGPGGKIIRTREEILNDYDAIFCDLWGCLHDGVKSFPRALKALEDFKASNGKVVLVTNAPRPIANVQYQIETIGIKKIHCCGTNPKKNCSIHAK